MSLDVYLIDETGDTVYTSNITHNLNTMAQKAGIYKELWRPDETNAKTAKDLFTPLAIGLGKLVSNPEYYKQFNASNGWGLYEHFVGFVKEYLKACLDNPDCTISVSR